MILPTIKIKEIDHAKAGEMVRERRMAAGMSGKQFAELMGIFPSLLCELEAGRRNWSEERFEKASQILTGVKTK